MSDDEHEGGPAGAPVACSRCGGEMRHVETPPVTAFGEWVLYGTRRGRRREECERCGSTRVSLTFHLRRRTPFGAPWRVVQTLRSNRSVEPVPVFYVGLVVVGAAVGIGVELITAFPWWPVPLLAVAITWLYYLSSAFWGVRAGDLPFELKVALRPGRAWDLEQRRTEDVVRRSPFPLFGLDETWDGDRWIGGYGMANGRLSEVSLGHSREGPDGDVRVLVGVRAPAGDVERAMRWAASDLELELCPWTPAWPPPENGPRLPGIETWSSVTVPLDGAPVELRRMAEGDRWVAIGTVEELLVTLDARRLPVELVSLVTVSDVNAYVVGTRRRNDEMRRRYRGA